MVLNQWNRALVTGASSGIGLAIAEQLAGEGTDLVVVARNAERLAALAEQLDVDVEVIVADLSQRDELATVEARLAAIDRPIDLLVNNAGFGHSGEFLGLDIDDESSVIEVNIVALQRLAHAAGTAMSERGRGGILNVSSVAGSAPAPKAATYAATKAFVTSFSEALSAELGPHGVVVSCLCPGLTRTEFQQRANADTSKYPDPLWQDAATVAAAGLRGMAEGKVTVIPGMHNKAFTGLMKVLPGSAIRWATRRVERQQMT